MAVTDGVRQLLNDLKSSNGTVTPFVFLSVRFRAAADFRFCDSTPAEGPPLIPP